MTRRCFPFIGCDKYPIGEENGMRLHGEYSFRCCFNSEHTNSFFFASHFFSIIIIITLGCQNQIPTTTTFSFLNQYTHRHLTQWD